MSKSSGGEDEKPEMRIVVGGGPTISIQNTFAEEYQYDEYKDEVIIEGEDGNDIRKSFDSWAANESAWYAKRAVVDKLRDELESLTNITAGVGRTDYEEIEGFDREKYTTAVAVAPYIEYYSHYDDEGNLVSEPEVEFDTLVESAPRTIESTLIFDSKFDRREHVSKFPTVCERTWQEQN